MKRAVIPSVIWSIALLGATPSVGAGDQTAAADRSVTPQPPRVQSLVQFRQNARNCWRRLVDVDFGESGAHGISQMAIDRMLLTAHGDVLVTDLCRLLSTDDASGPRISVRFVDHLNRSIDDADGAFRPRQVGAEHYEILVRNRYREAAVDPNVFVYGEYPNNPECSFVFFYCEAASSMAQTLYHELLHVWFLNAHAHERRRFPTGHGSAARCQFEDDFITRLRGHADELSTIEGHLPPVIGTAALR